MFFFFAISLLFRSLSTKYLVSLVSFSLFFFNFFQSKFPFHLWNLLSFLLAFLVNKNFPCPHFFPFYLPHSQPYVSRFFFSLFWLSSCFLSLYVPSWWSLSSSTLLMFTLLFFLLNTFSKTKIPFLSFFLQDLCVSFQSPFFHSLFRLPVKPLQFFFSFWFRLFFFGPFSILLFRKYFFSPNKISFSNVLHIFFWNSSWFLKKSQTLFFSFFSLSFFWFSERLRKCALNFVCYKKKHAFILTNGQNRNSSLSRSLRWQSILFSKESLFFFSKNGFLNLNTKHQKG